MFLTNDRKYGWNEQRNHYRRLGINWRTSTKTAEKTKAFEPRYNLSSFVNVVDELSKVAKVAEEMRVTC